LGLDVPSYASRPKIDDSRLNLPSPFGGVSNFAFETPPFLFHVHIDSEEAVAIIARCDLCVVFEELRKEVFIGKEKHNFVIVQYFCPILTQ
jgi:hypothetical protein